MEVLFYNFCGLCRLCPNRVSHFFHDHRYVTGNCLLTSEETDYVYLPLVYIRHFALRLSRGHVQPADISDQRLRALPSLENVSLLVFNTHGISVVCNCIIRAVCDKSSCVQCSEFVIHHLLRTAWKEKKCMDHNPHQLKDQSRTIASPRVLLRLWHSQLLHNWRLLSGQ